MYLCGSQTLDDKSNRNRTTREPTVWNTVVGAHRNSKFFYDGLQLLTIIHKSYHNISRLKA